MNAHEILARTLYAEAGPCAVRGIEALAALVLRRARAALACPVGRARFAAHAQASTLPAMVAAVCRAPFQFACWRPDGLAWNPPEADPALAICRRIAVRALAGSLPDLAAGATHFHRTDALPGWAVGRMPLAETGGLALYRVAA
ncbi:MAG: cell wall hydrolase [Alphaproteobacteria bacterium]|nr:cell wall hydrolase [Alphaproteobacteria bacterium]